jgi:hypothetical protein
MAAAGAGAGTGTVAPMMMIDLSKTSLLNLCRSFIVANLERFPPHIFDHCEQEEFETLVEVRHKKTKPKEGSGGIDGTGRVAPAISERCMAEFEEYVPGLSSSSVTDKLVWKDCVEYSFRRGGLQRPRALEYPWPCLIDQLHHTAQVFEMVSLESAEASEAISKLSESPMNVALLQASGVGKVIGKCLKKNDGLTGNQNYQRLDKLLTTWKALAANSGITVKGEARREIVGRNEFDADAEDLELAETCQSWRQLFAALKNREEERRSNQGKRMRERRANLASDRPRVVKVRPTVAKHSKILAGRSAVQSTGSSPGKSKLEQLRKETATVASRERRSPSQHVTKMTSSSFGAAVAFASVSKKNRKGKSRSKVGVITLAGGKRMTVPEKVVQGAGSRQMAFKWKQPPPR